MASPTLNLDIKMLQNAIPQGALPRPPNTLRRPSGMGWSLFYMFIYLFLYLYGFDILHNLFYIVVFYIYVFVRRYKRHGQHTKVNVTEAKEIIISLWVSLRTMSKVGDLDRQGLSP